MMMCLIAGPQSPHPQMQYSSCHTHPWCTEEHLYIRRILTIGAQMKSQRFGYTST